MRIVVFGGTGRIGSQVVASLREQGIDAVAASPASGVDAYTGEGVADTVRGADVTIDVTNAMIFEEEAAIDFFGTASRHVVAAAREAGVRRHVLLSIVGTSRLVSSGYLAGKRAQERAVEEGGVPFSIVRATQFIEFLPGIAESAVEDGRIVVPPTLLQPIASREVSAAIVDVALAAHAPERVEVAGPERLSMAEALRRGLEPDDLREIVESADATYFGAALGADELVPLGAARLGTIRISDLMPVSAHPSS